LHNEEERPIKENDHAVDALRYALWWGEEPGAAEVVNLGDISVFQCAECLKKYVDSAVLVISI
jgi:hypothetical protein